MAAKQYQFKILLLSLLSGGLIGYCTAVIAGALVFLDKVFEFTASQEGFIVSSILIGGFFGALYISLLVKKIGQKKSLMLTSLGFIIFSLLSSIMTGFYSLALCRFLLGLAVGAMTMLGPLYIAETSPEKLRGFFVSSIQLAITIGIFLAYVSNYCFSHTANWQAMFAISAIPAFCLFILLFYLYESPRWLRLHGYTERAQSVYYAIHHQQWDIDTNTNQNKIQHASLKDLFNPIIFPAMLFAASLFFFQNLSGIDAILYYAPNIFKHAGFDELSSAFEITLLLGLVNILSTIASMLLVDKLGRRPLLNYGLMMMALGLFLFSIINLFPVNLALLKYLSVICLFIFLIAFAMSMGPIPYLIMSELFPLHLRAAGMGIVSATAWGINAIVTLAYPIITQSYGISIFFFISATVCTIALIISFIFCPETKACSLEGIEHNLKLGKPLRQIGK